MARVSSDEQAKGYSLNIQEENMRKWCEDRGVEVVKCFREDHSAKNFNRPEWKELKKYARINQKLIDMVLVTTWDRFSRNTTDAFNELHYFRNIGIEIQSIQQPIDFSIPESKVLLAIYLTLPEVDNDRRSMKIKEGIRAALKSGRWSRGAPIGYKNSRDENNKPIIVPNEKADCIRFAFKEISQGSSQQFVLKNLKQFGFTVSRNNLSLLLRNPLYVGKVRVPANETEPEEIVEGVHEPIIDYELFIKVQDILNKGYKDRNRKKENSAKPELPLRGILFCSNCGKKVTGSASRSKTGAKHFYYHCNYCKKERYRAEVANTSIESFFDELKFRKSAMSIYTDMLKLLSAERNNTSMKKNDLKEVKSQISILESRIDKLQNLLIDGAFTIQEYEKKKAQFQIKLDELKAYVLPPNSMDKETESKVERGINLLVNAKKIYQKADVVEKQKLLSSIFPENLEFSEQKCRTPRINQLLVLMLLVNRDLDEIKKGQLFKNLELSRPVESPGIEPGSKQAIKELSTRLVSAWIFDSLQGRKLPQTT